MIEDVKELERIITENQATSIEVNGRQLVFGKFQEVKRFKPFFNKISFNELSSLIKIIVEEWKTKEKLYIHVESPYKVSTFSSPDVDLERQLPYSVEYAGGKQFKFGEWQDYENFIISLRSLFAETYERNKLLELVASVKNVESNEISDNGISQSAIMKKGAILNKDEVKAIYRLAPYRTFRDVEQVASEYLFRITTRNGSLSFALFEADGGNWVKEQKKVVENFLQEAFNNEAFSDKQVVVIS